ncbi:MAG TPA: ubiquinol-cytochrome c reductase iron-sulfur subunit [Burkholderiaceae bacterium]|nr:ubiquinol-cytochrome c reductase iron-sulfur subunit [Burkholderiaceae bacterium]
MSTEAMPEPIDGDRRAALISTCVVGGVGTVAAATPFVLSFQPSERAKAAGAPVEADIGSIAPGEMKTFEWQGKPVWVLHRTPEMLKSIKNCDDRVADPNSQRTAYPTPPYAKNEFRSIKPEYLVVVGICSHLGCSPKGPFGAGVNPQLGADEGFVCPCHGSTFDLAGRVFKNKPAPDNLAVPPYKFLSDSVVLIGEDSKA